MCFPASDWDGQRSGRVLAQRAGTFALDHELEEGEDVEERGSHEG